MIGFLVSGTLIWPAFERQSLNAELGVTVDWSTIESASVAAGVSCACVPVLYPPIYCQKM